MDKEIKILIVDDDPAMRDLITLAFSRSLPSEWQLYDVKNGEEALESITKEIPSLIILDILLPGFNGFQLIQKMKDQGVFDKTEIIAISGLGFKETVQKLLDAGVTNFLVKPFDIALLVERAQKLVGSLIDQ